MKPAAGRRSAALSLDSACAATTLLAVVAAFCISPMALDAWGLHYDAAGGSSALKIHPSTYLFVVALLLRGAARLAPADRAEDAGRFDGAALFGAAWAIALAFTLFVQHAPAAALVDTFLPAFAMLILSDHLEPVWRGRLIVAVHAIMTVNAILGVAEFVAHVRLTPFIIADRAITFDPRSTALLGHPLANASATGIYALMLMRGADLPLPALRVPMVALQLVAMVAFGGRTAFVLVLAFALLAALPSAAGVLNGRRFDARVALAFALGAPLAVGALLAASSTDLVASFLDRFVDDKGSAQARVALFGLFDGFSPEEVLLGPDPRRLASRQYSLGLEYGIENSWIGMVFQYGAVIADAFMVGLAAFIRDLLARLRRPAWLPLAYFLILATSSASLNVKSFVFNHFVLLALTLFARPRAPALRPAAPIPRASAARAAA